MSVRVRIVCKLPPEQHVPMKREGGLVAVGFMPSLVDTTVFIVHEDGREEAVDGVSEVRWGVHGDNVAMATIRVSAEVDVEALGEVVQR